jgi:membrane protease YdiL (CAAX protease family)
MHPAIASLMTPIVSLLGIVFVTIIVVRDEEARPISLPMTVLCLLIVGSLAYGFSGAAPIGPWAWPATIALCAAFLAAGVWDQRAYLFGVTAPDRGHVASSGRSMGGLMLIAVTEELLFRGLMQSSLLTTFSGAGGALMAIFIVNLAFGAMHGRHGLTFAMSAGFFGLIMSMTVIMSGSIWPAAITHGLWNMIIGLARQRSAAAA